MKTVDCWLVHIGVDTPFHVWAMYREILASGVCVFYNRTPAVKPDQELGYEHIYAFNVPAWSVEHVTDPARLPSSGKVIGRPGLTATLARRPR